MADRERVDSRYPDIDITIFHQYYRSLSPEGRAFLEGSLGVRALLIVEEIGDQFFEARPDHRSALPLPWAILAGERVITLEINEARDEAKRQGFHWLCEIDFMRTGDMIKALAEFSKQGSRTGLEDSYRRALHNRQSAGFPVGARRFGKNLAGFVKAIKGDVRVIVIACSRCGFLAYRLMLGKNLPEDHPNIELYLDPSVVLSLGDIRKMIAAPRRDKLTGSDL